MYDGPDDDEDLDPFNEAGTDYDNCVAGDEEEYWDREIEKATDKWEP